MKRVSILISACLLATVLLLGSCGQSAPQAPVPLEERPATTTTSPPVASPSTPETELPSSTSELLPAPTTTGSPTTAPVATSTLLPYNPPDAPASRQEPVATVAFMRYTNDSWDEYIYLVESDGTGLRKLTPDKDVQESFPQFSPDGQKLIFSRRPKGGNPSVWVMNVDGTGRTRLAAEWASMPAWSPDGRQIAFVSAYDGQTEISVMSSDGSNAKRLTNDPSPDMLPVWSPDGTQIAFLSNRGAVHRWWVINADGSGERLLADIKVYEEGVSAPGTLLRALWGRDVFLPGEYFLVPVITKERQMVTSVFMPKDIGSSMTYNVENVIEITGATGLSGIRALVTTSWSNQTKSFDIECNSSGWILGGPENDFASSAMVLKRR